MTFVCILQEDFHFYESFCEGSIVNLNVYLTDKQRLKASLAPPTFLALAAGTRAPSFP